MATFTNKEIAKMATAMVSGMLANPANNMGQYDTGARQRALKDCMSDVRISLESLGHSITDDPFQSAVIEAADKDQ